MLTPKAHVRVSGDKVTPKHGQKKFKARTSEFGELLPIIQELCFEIKKRDQISLTLSCLFAESETLFIKAKGMDPEVDIASGPTRVESRIFLPTIKDLMPWWM
ncbi:hypothetical protein AVEN_72731-1 [Araneus ventricosus]|uniref:Uncharacterized protein n=1 Tax=Araneus ventricosus TaxID=182803 RepID=A0A4Y2DRE9_ARAVE|nr:hypothetical protein AVEN_72731-1 [Araneus ventricosus]